MRVLIAGGVYRLSEPERSARQPAPEEVLSCGLMATGTEVVNVPLSDLRSVALERRVDLVHVHHLSKAALAAVLSPLGRPVVFTPHSGALPTKPQEAWAYPAITALMAAGICLSEREAMMRERRGRRAGKWHVIANGLELPATPVLRRSAPQGECRLLFVGQLIATKRVDAIIRAISQEQRFSLRIVFHHDALELELRHLVEDLGLAQRVTFVGQLSGDALFDEYRNAHALVLPSIREALPSVVTEALSTGLPIVATDVGGVAEQVGTAGILVNDQLDLATALRSLTAAYPALALAAEERAAFVRAHYSVDSMISRHLALYEALLEGRVE